ncbi:hypothetical protein THAOC_21233 [Thalassiosira oceanica]|uniref:Uncharacterized protein n=1 Tax=Thalassiosira oceanica TaxID=159749 RepID=K0S1I2_THAOC|nr:hypothetical protein THAOC_21233 [Thalassiosira oceanica]|eukprot:EJK58629.1 hypothetical protein THAOC_21233 [Thalassiosira oceanica]
MRITHLVFISLALLLSGAAFAFVPPFGLTSTSGLTSSVLPMSSSSAAVSCSETSLPPEETLDALLAVAIEASKLAGDIIIGNKSGAEVTKTKANPKDLLTEIDPLCEKTIREAVAKSFPDHDFLGEEDVSLLGRRGGRYQVTVSTGKARERGGTSQELLSSRRENKFPCCKFRYMSLNPCRSNIVVVEQRVDGTLSFSSQL